MAALTTALALSILPVTATPAFATYDKYSAASYADQFAVSANTPSYPVFGSDCTNFVSQAERAGGYPFRNAYSNASSATSWWIYGSGSNIVNFTWSDSWAVADGYYNFLMADSPGGIPEGTAPGSSTAYWDPSAVTEGDVLFYDWGQGEGISHAAIQVGYGTDPNMYPNQVWDGNYVDEHTSNRYHAFWSLRPYNADYATTTIYFMHIDANN